MIQEHPSDLKPKTAQRSKHSHESVNSITKGYKERYQRYNGPRRTHINNLRRRLDGDGGESGGSGGSGSSSGLRGLGAFSVGGAQRRNDGGEGSSATAASGFLVCGEG
ncbi:unnamed protein product [Cochlearia groenlandica]